MIKISVIIPMYNAEKTIYDCIMSILKQTYKNIEIIVINNASSDKGLDICKKLQCNDNRIKIINTNIKGVSNARNIGIKNAIGEYIGFVDADDTIEEKMYEVLVNNLKRTNADISMCGYKIIDLNDEIIYHNNTKKIEIYKPKEAVKELLRDKSFSGSVWNKLFKKELCETVKFDTEFSVDEDRVFLLKCILLSKEIVYEDVCEYNYIKRYDSVTNKKMSTDNKKMMQLIESNKVIRNIIEKKYLDLKDYITLNEFMSMLNLYRFLATSQNRKELLEDLKHVRNILKKIDLKPITGELSFLLKMEYFFIIYLNSIYIYIIAILNNINIIKKIRRKLLGGNNENRNMHIM